MLFDCSRERTCFETCARGNEQVSSYYAPPLPALYGAMRQALLFFALAAVCRASGAASPLRRLLVDNQCKPTAAVCLQNSVCCSGICLLCAWLPSCATRAHSLPCLAMQGEPARRSLRCASASSFTVAARAAAAASAPPSAAVAAVADSQVRCSAPTGNHALSDSGFVFAALQARRLPHHPRRRLHSRRLAHA